MVIPDSGLVQPDRTYLPIDLYAKFITYDECKFFGVNPPENGTNGYYVSGCTNNIWTPVQRDSMTARIISAQEKIEDIAGVKFGRARILNEIVRPDRAGIACVDWKAVLGGATGSPTKVGDGITVADGTAADYVFTFTPTSAVTQSNIDKGDVLIYYPDTTVEIHPTSIIRATNGDLTITVPKCRAVAFALRDTPIRGLDYTVQANFQQEVDVMLQDLSTYTFEATYQYSTCNGCYDGYDIVTAAGSWAIKDATRGIIRVWPTAAPEFTNGSGSCGCRLRPDCVTVSYYAGVPTTEPDREAIFRLANASRNTSPCPGCQHTTRIWERDKEEMKEWAGMRNPFGEFTKGAWTAARQAFNLKKRWSKPQGSLLSNRRR